MKKLLALLLAALMIFSMGVVAFAEGEDTNEDPAVVDVEDTEGEAEEEFDIMDMPLWSVKAGAKIAKVVIKIALAFLKVASKLGLVDVEELMQGLIEQYGGALEGETGFSLDNFSLDSLIPTGA